MATTAAILDVLLKADTNQAVSALRQYDSTLDRTARTARTTGRANEQLTRTNDRLGRTTRTASRDHDNLNRTTGKLGSTLKTAAGAAAGAAAAYVSISQAKTAVDRTQDLFSATMNLKKGFGLSAKAASGFNAAVLSRGGEISATAGAFRTLGKNIEEAGKGTESSVKAFRAFGVSQKELRNLNKDQLLFALSDGMGQLGDKTRETAAANQLFGRTAAKEVIPILRDGSKGLKEQIALAEEAGATFSDKGGIENMKELGKAQRELEIRTLGLQVQFTKHLVPALIDVIHWVAQAGKDIRKFFETPFGKALLEAIGTTAKRIAWLARVSFKAFMWMVNAAKDAAQWISNAFNNVKRAVGNVIQWIRNAWKNAIEFIKKIWNNVTTFIGNKVQDIIGFFKGLPGKIQNAFADVGESIKDKFNDVLDFFADWVNKVIDILNNIPGVDIGHIDTGGGGPSKQKQQAKKKGGGKQLGGLASIVPGYGAGDKVHMSAMVEPGEGIFVMNRNAMGALQAMNDANPRFARGGAMLRMDSAGGALSDIGSAASDVGSAVGGAFQSVGDFVGKLPSPGDLPDWMSGVGTFAINAAKDFIKDKVGGLLFGGGGGSVAWGAIDKLAADLGLTRGTLTGRIGQAGSRHGIMGPGGRAMATDYSGPVYGSKSGPMANFTRQLIPGALSGALNELFYDPLGGWDQGSSIGAIGGHNDHVHVAFQKGGSVPRPKHGDRWIDVGSHVSVDEAATLLWQAGASPGVASQLARVLPGESGGRIRAHNPSGASGIFQIMMPLHSGIVNRYGGNVWDVRTNAMAALDIFGAQGFGAWEAARSGPAGQILEARTKSPWKLLQEKGTFKKQSDAVKYLMRFGISKDEAQKNAAAYMLRAGGGGGTGGGKVNALQALIASGRKWKSDKAEVKYLMGLGYSKKEAQKAAKKYNGPVAAAAAAEDAGAAEDPFASINELIGEQNLLKLQNYNLGMAQHPLLGLANPAKPGLTPLMSAAAAAAGGGGQTAMTVGAAAPSVHTPTASVGNLSVTGGLRSTGVTVVIEDGAVNANRIKKISGKEAKRRMKRAARRGNRRLPSGGGGGP